ncbi:hypothetical protein [Pseudonocardia acaciae]|uniref:hypothetical protein n=1 Tax=Pseudonocardia acaciae TaxID=551276 RepID=UPI000565D326|nr:hypothetical protein [Pseudonocardia acaciae]
MSAPQFPDTAPLGQAREWLRQHAVGKGAACPCCQQRAQVYHRGIHAGMARALVVMYREHGTEWQNKTVTLRGLGSGARDESLLRYWGLLEEDQRPREDGGRAGWWRVTPLGRAFVLGEATVPKYARVYDGRCLGLDGEAVSIVQCLGKRFNLLALLEGRA